MTGPATELAARELQHRREINLRSKRKAFIRDQLSQIEAWGDAMLPACGCGCGEMVPMLNVGPRVFVNLAHHGYWLWGEREKAAAARKGRAQERNVDLVKLRDVLAKIRVKNGWTWEQMARQCGVPKNSLTGMLFDKRGRTVTKPRAEELVKRALGVPMPPNAWMLKEMRKVELSGARAKREMTAESEREREREQEEEWEV